MEVNGCIPSAEAKSMYFSMAEMSVAEMSIGRNVRGRNVRGRNVLAETSVAERSVAEMSEHHPIMPSLNTPNSSKVPKCSK